MKYAFMAVLAFSAQAQEPAACESQPGLGDVREVTCRVPAEAQRLHFSADFAGSHDDTKLSLAAALDGAPVRCEEGSKTESLFEDGDIRLECRLTVEPASATRTLRVMLVWHHAQYERYGFSLR